MFKLGFTKSLIEAGSRLGFLLFLQLLLCLVPDIFMATQAFSRTLILFSTVSLLSQTKEGCEAALSFVKHVNNHLWGKKLLIYRKSGQSVPSLKSDWWA